jgi:predicted nucleic acid-binding Zn ribbon protein
MPKYIPTQEDIYPIKRCCVCGADVLDDKETCSDFCAQQWEIFKEDYEASMLDILDALFENE